MKLIAHIRKKYLVKYSNSLVLYHAYCKALKVSDVHLDRKFES